MEKEVFYSINKKEFVMEEEVIANNYCSVRETGYLIVPDGRLIVVPSGLKHHGQVFSEYVSKYLEKPIDEIKQDYNINSDNGLVYIPLLNSLGLIAYFGVGLGPNICARGMESSQFYDMRGMLNIPANTEILTLEQLITCQKLLDTNISFTGREKYPIEIGDIETGYGYTKDDIDMLVKEKMDHHKM